MGAPVEGEVEALLSDATAALRDGTNRLDVLDDAVTSILATLRALSTVLDRLEGEVAQLRGEVAATRKIAKQAKKRAGKAEDCERRLPEVGMPPFRRTIISVEADFLFRI